MVWIKFLVLIIVAIKSNAMPVSKIEDFSSFLGRISQLDQNIKNEDDDDLISDNVWEKSGKFEGDLIINELQRSEIFGDVPVISSRNGVIDSRKKWPRNEVVYYIEPKHFSKEQIQAIHEAMLELAHVSCVSFRPLQEGEKAFVAIKGDEEGCFSNVGYQGEYQELNLFRQYPVGQGCFRPEIIVHELLHTLGFYHMHSSTDRDNYVDVLWENIIEKGKPNFRKYGDAEITDYGLGYDYESVLHYSPYAFSSNGEKTLVPKQKGAKIGQSLGPSEKDIFKLKIMYCNADPENFDSDKALTTRKPVYKKQNGKNRRLPWFWIFKKHLPLQIKLPFI